ncbi:hypothetical protein SBBP1_740016 [Burkholderiales bacterium]|nr:hypothetical protein SBBP1_740016 [Burkholderiales bacterium]
MSIGAPRELAIGKENLSVHSKRMNLLTGDSNVVKPVR